MGIGMVLDMASAATPDRIAMGPRSNGVTYRRLDELASRGAGLLGELGARHVVFVGVNGPVLPALMFAAGRAGIPLAPLNYRLPAAQLLELIDRLDEPIVVADADYVGKLDGCAHRIVSTDEFLGLAEGTAPLAGDRSEDEGTAIVLFTSGTTSAPKGVLLRHRHLLSYLLNTVEFGSAAEQQATLVSTPPYHIAGLGAVLSNVYSGRRMVYLPDFTPQAGSTSSAPKASPARWWCPRCSPASSTTSTVRRPRFRLSSRSPTGARGCPSRSSNVRSRRSVTPDSSTPTG